MPKKKDFTIIEEEENEIITASEKTAEAVTEPDKEIRSARMSAVLRPSVCRAIEKIAVMQERSKNDLLNEIIENYVKRHAEELKKYDATFGKP